MGAVVHRFLLASIVVLSVGSLPALLCSTAQADDKG
jgi:hypothetical protein